MAYPHWNFREEDLKRILSRNRVYLVQNVDIKGTTLWDYLLEKRVLSKFQRESIEAGNHTSFNQVSKLLDHLGRRTRNDICNFFDCLILTEQHAIVQAVTGISLEGMLPDPNDMQAIPPAPVAQNNRPIPGQYQQAGPIRTPTAVTPSNQNIAPQVANQTLPSAQLMPEQQYQRVTATPKSEIGFHNLGQNGDQNVNIYQQMPPATLNTPNIQRGPITQESRQGHNSTASSQAAQQMTHGPPEQHGQPVRPVLASDGSNIRNMPRVTPHVQPGLQFQGMAQNTIQPAHSLNPSPLWNLPGQQTASVAAPVRTEQEVGKQEPAERAGRAAPATCYMAEQVRQHQEQLIAAACGVTTSSDRSQFGFSGNPGGVVVPSSQSTVQQGAVQVSAQLPQHTAAQGSAQVEQQRAAQVSEAHIGSVPQQQRSVQDSALLPDQMAAQESAVLHQHRAAQDSAQVQQERMVCQQSDAQGGSIPQQQRPVQYSPLPYQQSAAQPKTAEGSVQMHQQGAAPGAQFDQQRAAQVSIQQQQQQLRAAWNAPWQEQQGTAQYRTPLDQQVAAHNVHQQQQRAAQANQGGLNLTLGTKRMGDPSCDEPAVKQSRVAPAADENVSQASSSSLFTLSSSISSGQQASQPTLPPDDNIRNLGNQSATESNQSAEENTESTNENTTRSSNDEDQEPDSTGSPSK